MSQRSRLYIGNLPPDVREKDLEDVFRKYGKIDHLDLRTNKGPPFAFLDYTDPRDAEDAIKGRDGYDFDGYRMRVEFPRSYRDSSGGFSRGVGGGRYERGSDRGGDRHGGGGGGDRGGFSRNRNDSTMRRSQYRVFVSGLPPSGSWQDLKDHMREAGDVCYADVNKDGTGHVEFLRKEDMDYAVKKLDDTKFRSHEGETAYVRVRAEGASGTGSANGKERDSRRSRTRSPRRSRSAASKNGSRSRSPVDRRDKSEENGDEVKRERSASGSPRGRSKSASKSRSASRSRSASVKRE